MEGSNLPPGNMIRGTHYVSVDLQGNSLQMHAPSSGNQAFSHSQMAGHFSAPMNRNPASDHLSEFQFGEHGKADHPHAHHHNHQTKNCMSDDEEPGMTEDAPDSQSGKGKKSPAWQRMKWTDAMVKLLITAVSYTGEEPGTDLSSRRRNFLQKKGKWKAISKVMDERGCHVSPQQCEDKFNDLNKRYKRLTDILGRGTACKIVENPTLLDRMDHLSNKMKDDVRKILSSKHLFFEEMCSYHNNNRIHLPDDPSLQRSLQIALSCKEEHDPRKGAAGDADEGDQSADTDYEENDEEHHIVYGNIGDLCMHKRMQHTVDHDDVGFGTSSSSHDCSRRSDPHGITVDINKVIPDGTNLALVQKELASRSLELEKQRLQIKAQGLELAKQRLKWVRFSRKKDRELERMRTENEQMDIENKYLELELRHKKLELELKLKGNDNHA